MFGRRAPGAKGRRMTTAHVAHGLELLAFLPAFAVLGAALWANRRGRPPHHPEED
jgi:hypothetical protein